jgi:hypothetical protein
MVAIACIFVPGWLAVASIWTDCEIIVPNSSEILLPQWCPQSELPISALSGHILSTSVAITKDSLAWLVTISYVVYVISASIVWRTQRKAYKDDYGMETEMKDW